MNITSPILANTAMVVVDDIDDSYDEWEIILYLRPEEDK